MGHYTRSYVSAIPPTGLAMFSGSDVLQRCRAAGAGKRNEHENGCNARPHPDPLPRGEGTAIAPSDFANDGPATTGPRPFKDAANDSPSHSLAHRMGVF